ncbi:MAG: SDR family oxidoreductase [Acetobacteraceae bacterium]|nr:SDR family oxidoreductase [Acetobacteraceae bacterium]
MIAGNRGGGMGRLDGKVAIVTGAASRAEGVGNGAAAAILFAREGARVVLVNRSAARAEALAEAIRAEGGSALAVAADVGEEADAARVAQVALERFGRIDVLHNNVGIGAAGTPETVTMQGWEMVFRTNLTTALLCCRAVLPAMRAQGGGAIINVSSIAGMTGLSGSAGAVAYTTTKAGLQGFTLSIAADYASHGIRANCIVVGTVNTPMVAHLGEEGRERRRRGVPLQSEGTGWDVGHAAVYLASDEARWVTGVMLPIDGGFLAVRAWPR